MKRLQFCRPLIVAAVCVLALFLAPAAEARNAGELGGFGGVPFTSECRPGHALIGVNLRSGTALDAIVAICIPLNGQRTEWEGQAYEPTQYWGGKGGRYKKAACQPGDVVKTLKVRAGPWDDLFIVKSIAIRCRDLGSDYEYDVVPDSAGTVTKKKSYQCDSGEIASGIYGQSGTLVDKVGLICAP